MPIGSDRMSTVKREVLERKSRSRGLVPYFPMDKLALEMDPLSSLHVIIEQIEASGLVIADLSKERPSCYYELGIAEALGARVILIAEKGTSIHQSANRMDTHFYSNIDSYTDLIDIILDQ
jgi:hypothetical protein